VFLNESAENMYGKLMAQPDENLPQLFIDCTYVYTEEIEKIKKAWRRLASPSQWPLRLMTKILYSRKPNLRETFSSHYQ